MKKKYKAGINWGSHSSGCNTFLNFLQQFSIYSNRHYNIYSSRKMQHAKTWDVIRNYLEKNENL